MPTRASCPAGGPPQGLIQIATRGVDYVVALAGNPNTGKSCVFNHLTGLRQHVGNWPGKTVARAEGRFKVGDLLFKLVDLPGTYSLQSTSTDEEIARDFVLFGNPDVTIVVVDATCLERNLNLVLQVLEITDRVVVCLNLMDEARRKGLRVDADQLAQELGVPVIPAIANAGVGLDKLSETVSAVAQGKLVPQPRRAASVGRVLQAADALSPLVENAIEGIPNARWVAIRLLEQDDNLIEALQTGELEALVGKLQADGLNGTHTHVHVHAHDGEPGKAIGHGPEQESWVASRPDAVASLLASAADQREALGVMVADDLVAALYDQACRISRAVVSEVSAGRRSFDEKLDRLVTSRTWGFAFMLALLGVVFWTTIAGANVPSQMIANALFAFEDTLAGWCDAIRFPWWLTGLLVHGMYRALAWVIAVMLPPMAIFFPLFTLLEDFGYLPRVAFNMDRLFHAAGAHGKQALTMAMGFGCNAAGVTACRIIDSPRERLIAIITNNFVPCNGRFPTLIMLATVFVAPVAGPGWGSVAGAATLCAAVLIGIFTTLAVSAFLSRTWLKGEPSAFALEMPSYRRPRILQVLYTSIIDRTLFVLWRACVFAAPAGLVIWTLGNVMVGDQSLFAYCSGLLDPLGHLIGLDGVILLAYIVAIPANEIVVPTIFMGYNVLSEQAAHAGQHVMVELDGIDQISRLLTVDHGWTLLTAICLILFCLLHNPCSTTIFTIWKETHSKRWTAVATLMPLTLAFIVCFVVAQVGRLLGMPG